MTTIWKNGLFVQPCLANRIILADFLKNVPVPLAGVSMVRWFVQKFCFEYYSRAKMEGYVKEQQENATSSWFYHCGAFLCEQSSVSLNVFCFEI